MKENRCAHCNALLGFHSFQAETKNWVVAGAYPTFDFCSQRCAENYNNNRKELNPMTTQTKQTHTPGPWHLCQSVQDSRTVFVGTQPFPTDAPYTGFIICTPTRTTQEYAANARLIAAAPELLEACKFILHQLSPPDSIGGLQCKLYSDSLHPTDDDKTVVDYLREVVSKARGQ